MNKYQDALNKIKCIGEKDLWNDRHLEWTDTLQELVSKETPKKPIKHSNSFYRCQNCDELFQNHHYQDYCPNCGQKLDWSE